MPLRHNTSPPTWLALLEPSRALLELGSLIPASQLLKKQPRGDGHPVMVLPGFMTNDMTTVFLRRYLHHLGYRSRRWKMGLNLGPHFDETLEQRMAERLQRIHAHSGKPVSIIGWSLGGMYARELAREYPECVRQVITLGSPLLDHPDKIRNIKIWKLYEWASGTSIEDSSFSEFIERIAQPVKDVPVTAIYSRSDGLVPAEDAQLASLPMKQNIEVIGSHVGMVMNPFVNYLIADRLTMHKHNWQPFEFNGWRRWVYR